MAVKRGVQSSNAYPGTRNQEFILTLNGPHKSGDGFCGERIKSRPNNAGVRSESRYLNLEVFPSSNDRDDNPAPATIT